MRSKEEVSRLGVGVRCDNLAAGRVSAKMRGDGGCCWAVRGGGSSRGSVSDLTAAETQHSWPPAAEVGTHTHYTHYTQAHVCTLHTTQCTVTTTTHYTHQTHQTPSSRSHAAPSSLGQPPHSTPGWRGPAVVPIAGDRSLVQRHTTVPSRAQHLQHSTTAQPHHPASCKSFLVFFPQ